VRAGWAPSTGMLCAQSLPTPSSAQSLPQSEPSIVTPPVSTSATATVSSHLPALASTSTVRDRCRRTSAPTRTKGTQRKPESQQVLRLAHARNLSSIRTSGATVLGTSTGGGAFCTEKGPIPPVSALAGFLF